MAFVIESEQPLICIWIRDRLGTSELNCLAANLTEALEKQLVQAAIYISFNLDEFSLSVYADFPLVQLLASCAEIYQNWHERLELRFLLMSEETLVPLALYIAKNLTLPLHAFSSCEARHNYLRGQGLNRQTVL